MVNIDEIMTVVKGMPDQVLLSRYGNENGCGTLKDVSKYNFDDAINSFNLDRINTAIQEIPEHFTVRRTFSKATSYSLKHILE